MRAIATQFKSYVFRSRLESYIYEYIRLRYKPECLEYEPKHFSTNYYVPDFIVSSDTFHFAVEVKPLMSKAQWKKYTSWMQDFTSIQSISVFTKDEYCTHHRGGRTEIGDHDKQLFFQAINNVKEYIRKTNQHG